ncbi:MAG TPA: RNA repair transcriptional activator RtcR family protein [Paludibaculum sp.]|jgi:transcriptional regulator with AAA-type ATPase domain
MMITGRTLLAFVDYQDPYVQSLVGDEEQPGPVLTLLDTGAFETVALFHTPHTEAQTRATEEEIHARHPRVKVQLHGLGASNPKDFSRLIGLMAPHLRRYAGSGDLSVCASSGTAEMRAIWYLLVSTGQIQARLLQVKPSDFASGEPARVVDLDVESGPWLREDRYLGRMFSHSDDEPQPSVMSMRMPMPASEPAPPPELDGLDEALAGLEIYVDSALLRAAAEKAAMIAVYDAPVLIGGETGTGKELFAKLIHRLSDRQHGPLIAVNCASIPGELFESQLFGHEKGSFTGASQKYLGRFREARGGTLFLDEIGELTPSAQAKLLRVVQEGVVEPIGGQPVKVNVRLVAATNRDLDGAVRAGRFRDDLLYRLRVCEIGLPPLRERRGEIPHLALKLLARLNRTIAKRERRLTQAALVRLAEHSWPGNVRELENVLKSSIILSREAAIDAGDLVFGNGAAKLDPFAALPVPVAGFNVDEFLGRVRTHLFLKALEITNGNQSRAADLLGVTKQAVQQFVKTHGDKAG